MKTGQGGVERIWGDQDKNYTGKLRKLEASRCEVSAAGEPPGPATFRSLSSTVRRGWREG